MFKRIIYTGLMGLLLASCSKKENKVEEITNEYTFKIPPLTPNMHEKIIAYPRVTTKKYKDGYEKKVNDSPYGSMLGTYKNKVDPEGCGIDDKVDIILYKNNTLADITDCTDDGKADQIQLEGYIDPIRDKRSENPKEFQLADEILKYWKSQ